MIGLDARVEQLSLAVQLVLAATGAAVEVLVRWWDPTFLPGGAR